MAIMAARAELLTFFVRSYHLKDALVAEAAALALTRNEIEKAISGDPELALLADLANLDKHHRLDRPPRSGEVPVIELPIHRAGAVRDGLDVASSTTAAWQVKLEGWGLL
jgi:hypothetical protein